MNPDTRSAKLQLRAIVSHQAELELRAPSSIQRAF
jgi:hypothetical protein